jgi:uncharacterized membrane protein
MAISAVHVMASINIIMNQHIARTLAGTALLLLLLLIMCCNLVTCHASGP